MAPTLPSDAVWFVTGTSSGMGLALFNTILETSGHRVVALSRNPKKIELPAASNESNTLLQAVDLSSEKSIEEAFNAAVSKFGRIDVVVNNAGYGLFSEFESTSTKEARDLFEINFWAPVHITRHALRVMREVNPKNSGGVIAQVSSVGGWITSPGQPFYHATKFALEGFTETVQKEVDPSWGIRFVIFEPGSVKTKWAGENMAGGHSQHPAYAGRGLATDKIKDFGPHISEKLGADAGKVASLMIKVIKDEDGKWGGQDILRLPCGADAWALEKGDVDGAVKNLEKWKSESESTSPGDVHETLKLIGLA